MMDDTEPLVAGPAIEPTHGAKTPGHRPSQRRHRFPGLLAWLVMLACLGVAALVLGLVLKVVDKKKHLGLEEPNIQ